jgi:hypothetical protein
LLRSAEKVREENYGFKSGGRPQFRPGHWARGQLVIPVLFHRARREKIPPATIAEGKISKAELILAHKDSFAYCDKASAGMAHASPTQMVKPFGGETPKLGVLPVNGT